MDDIIKRLLREALLTEGATPILYHFTTTNRLLNILDTNSFYLTPTVASKSDQNKGANYFMSFTRTKSNKHGYGTKFRSPNSVRIKVDGQKISQNNKVIPIDYWQYPRTPELMKQGGDEMEDRVISNKNEITNANKYIISIDVFISEKGIEQSVIDKANELNIKINFYNNLADFTNGNPSKAIEPTIKTVSNKREERLRLPEYTMGLLAYREPNIKEMLLNDLKNKYKVGDEVLKFYDGTMERYSEKLDYNLKDNDFTLTDLTASIGSELHNNKTSDNPIIRYITHFFINELKKKNVSTIKDYLRYKYYIGKKSPEDIKKDFNNEINKLIDNSFKTGLESLYFRTYTKDGEEIPELNKYPPLLNYLNQKVNEIKKYTSEYILNNDDMFRYSYVLGNDYISKAINLKDNSEVKNIANNIEDVNTEQLNRPIYEVLWDIDRFYYDEVKRIQAEFYK